LTRATLAALTIALLVAVVAPSIAVGTPEPTRRPQRTPRAERTERPERTPRPDETPQPPLAPVPVAIPPARTSLTVGYREPGVLGQAPLLLAQEAGYFSAAGFDEVRIIEVADTLGDLRSEQLDIGVVDAREAAAVASGEDTTLRAIAGFRNHAPDGTYGGDLLLTGPGLVADEPSTVIAFLTAYIRALQDLADPESAAEALAIIDATDLSLDPALAETWDDDIAVFAPFDGGFGSVDVEGGLGELDQWLADAGIELPDDSYFIASHTLNIAQALAGVDANPTSTFAGAPGITDLRIGLPPTEAGSPPITAAIDGGFFDDAGFTSVELLDVQEPLLGLLNGELELGIVDAETAAEGVAQGLPLVAIAGHLNAAGERDVVAASADLVEQEGSTVAAFLIAYIQGLQAIAAAPDAAGFAPFDGGFGDRAVDGGLGELGADLTAALGAEPDLGALISEPPLEYAQAWWSLPANPIRVPAPASITEAAVSPAPVETEEAA
jgi:ABC-type nitrate/sulfonate/bicarbonate transport system substrate-binding protein